MSTDSLVLYPAAATIVGAAALILIYLPRIIKATKEEKEASEIVRALLSELRSRMDKQDQRIVDQTVRLDILEGKLGGALGSRTEVSSPRQRRTVIAQSHGEPVILEVLALLVGGPKTSRDIESNIRRSREHTARLMKSLYESDLVSRNETKKPFVYGITDRGRALLEGRASS